MLKPNSTRNPTSPFVGHKPMPRFPSVLPGPNHNGGAGVIPGGRKEEMAGPNHDGAAGAMLGLVEPPSYLVDERKTWLRFVWIQSTIRGGHLPERVHRRVPDSSARGLPSQSPQGFIHLRAIHPPRTTTIPTRTRVSVGSLHCTCGASLCV